MATGFTLDGFRSMGAWATYALGSECRRRLGIGWSALNGVPWKTAGKKRLCHRRRRSAGPPSGSGIAMGEELGNWDGQKTLVQQYSVNGRVIAPIPA